MYDGLSVFDALLRQRTYNPRSKEANVGRLRVQQIRIRKHRVYQIDVTATVTREGYVSDV